MSEFSIPLNVYELSPVQPKELALTATPAQCRAIAKRLDLTELKDFSAFVTLTRHQAKPWVNLVGTFSAYVEQASVVSLAPVPQTVQETINVWLVQEQDAPPVESIDPLLEDDLEPDIDAQGNFDVGEILVQYLSLALPDYPRADEEKIVYQEDTPANPFDILKQLNTPKHE